MVEIKSAFAAVAERSQKRPQSSKDFGPLVRWKWRPSNTSASLFASPVL